MQTQQTQTKTALETKALDLFSWSNDLELMTVREGKTKEGQRFIKLQIEKTVENEDHVYASLYSGSVEKYVKLIKRNGFDFPQISMTVYDHSEIYDHKHLSSSITLFSLDRTFGDRS